MKRRNLWLPAIVLLTASTAALADDFRCGSTPCLIEAINRANATPAEDTITLVAGRTFPLERIHSLALQPTGLPLVTTPIVIRGNGAILQRNPTLKCDPNDESPDSPSFGLLAVAQGARLIVEKLTLRFGCGQEGGAILNHGRLELYGVTVEGNNAWQGGGVASRGPMLIARFSRFQNNEAISEGRGGGIYVETGAAQLNLCDLLDNRAGHGGGLAAHAATVQYNGTARSNHADEGGAILVEGRSQLTMDGAVVVDNSAGMAGGGILSRTSHLDISNTRIQNNRATETFSSVGEGGGIVIYSIDPRGLWSTIRSSSIIDNQATGFGGGLYMSGETGALLMIVNTTVAENSAGTAGGGLAATVGANVFVFHSTFARNDAASGSSVASLGATARVELSGSILGRPLLAGRQSCWIDVGAASLLSSGYNIDEDGSCGLTHPRDRSGIGAGLLPSVDTRRPNGWHHPLGIGSAAINAGNFTACGGLAELRFDQLGRARSDLQCDVGAIEFSLSVVK